MIFIRWGSEEIPQLDYLTTKIFMNKDQLIDSFIEILQCVSLEDVLVSPDEQLSKVISENGVDLLDFELAVTCFEATHRVYLDYADLEVEVFSALSIRRMIMDFLLTDGRELSDPLFITKRFVMFRDALIAALEERNEE